MKIAIYGRVSKNDGVMDYENQLVHLREYAHNLPNGPHLIKEYTDKVTATGKKERTQFREMMIDASRRKMDLVLFWSLDRFSREGVLTTLSYLNQLDSWRIAWRSYTEAYLDSVGPFKDVVISLMATLAKQEAIRISERTRAALDRHKKQIAKQGYSLNKAGKRFAALGRPKGSHKPVDFALVQRLRRDGMSLRDIARQVGLGHMTIKRLLRSSNSATNVK